MLKPRALRPGDRVAVVAPASSFAREAFDAGVAELRRLGFEPVYDESVFARARYTAGDAAVRAAAFRRAWARPGDRRADRRPRRLRQRADAAAPRSGRDPPHSQGLHRLQRQHVAAGLAHRSLRRRVVSRTDARRTARRRASRPTIATTFTRVLTRAGRGRRDHASTGGGAATRRGPRRPARRHADAAARVARHAVCVRSAGGAHPVHRRSRRTAVSDRPHADAAALVRHCSRARRRSSSASCRAATSRATAGLAIRPSCRRSARRLSRTGAVRPAVGPHRSAPA